MSIHFGWFILKDTQSSLERRKFYANFQAPAIMASHPTAQPGQFNMSTHSSMACHQPAPIPNMEVQSAIPSKRGPEDDVQFVSVQPVKKARGGRESPAAQIRQTPDQTNAPPLQAQIQGAKAHGAHLSGPDTASGPQPEASTSNRGVSFPGLENYVFPPPSNLKTSRTSHSSPVLSPRQVPQPLLPSQSQNTMHAPQGFRSLVPPPHFQIPWGMSALYPQAAPMNSEAPVSQPMPLPPIQPQHIGGDSAMDIDDQPLSMSMALRKPEPPRTPSHVSQMEPQKLPQCGKVPKARTGSPSKSVEQAKTVQPPSGQAVHSQEMTLPYPSPRQEPQSRLQTPSHTQTRTPTPTATQPRTHSRANAVTSTQDTAEEPQGPMAQQTSPPKGPCVICEQMRQQILFNQANGLPSAHLPQLAHSWHGQGPVPQVQMGHPSAGFGMVPNVLQSLQQRFQPISLGHLPMGYGMQPIPVQVQMQLQQRQVLNPDMNGNEPSQGVSPHNQQTQPTQGHQVASQLAPSQAPQYMQSQFPSLSQSVMMQRPLMTHQQALAPPPTSPQPSPQTTKTPVLPEPKKHSPNLIVDIAETCEALFPWDEVAKRHGVTRVKVVETFGAVIQLPLLRCTTDKKRHGKLATSRLREYTKAKKDAEVSNAASAAKTTPMASSTLTPAAPVAQSQVAQVQANQISANQTHNQALQVQAMQNQAMQAQAMQVRAMQAQVNQMYANQGHVIQNQPPSLLQPDQVHASRDRDPQTGVFEMANTISPLGLPSNLTNGLSGHWQQQ